MNINCAHITGTLLENPKISKTEHGTVCTFVLITKEIHGGHGSKRTNVEYHHIVLYGDKGKTFSTYNRKADVVSVRGPLKTKQIVHDNGYELLTEIIAEDVQWLPNYKVGQEIRKVS